MPKKSLALSEFAVKIRAAGFASLEDFATHLQLHPATVRAWCKTDRAPRAVFFNPSFFVT